MNVRVELLDQIRAIAPGPGAPMTGSRRSWTRTGGVAGAQVLAAAFTIAVRRRFRPGQDVRDITAFVARTRARYRTGDTLPPLETEAMIRAALGEVDLAGGIGAQVAIPMQVVIVGALLHDPGLSEGQLEAFISDVQTAVAEHF